MDSVNQSSISNQRGGIMASTEIIIDAPIEVVWEIMTNIHNYPEWNPFVVSVDFNSQEPMKVGDFMRLNVVFPKHQKSGKLTHSQERILVLDPPTTSTNFPKSARWEYKFVSWLHYCHLVTATRIQALTQVQSKDGKTIMTKYYTKERFGGCLAWFVPLKDVQEGFEAQAKALKAYAEQKARQE